jgi:hypothetical protein
MAAGSDQLYEPGKATALDEIVALVDHGMTPQMALRLQPGTMPTC